MNRPASLIALAVTVLAVAGCASVGNSPEGAPSAASSPVSCSSQLAAWRAGGASDQFSAVIDSLSGVQDATSALAQDLTAGNPTTSDQSQLDSIAGQLQSTAQDAAAMLPPSCVPGMRAADSAALADAVKAAVKTEVGVTKIGSGSDKVGVADLDAAQSEITAAGKKYDAAVSDAQALGGAG
ncbi:MAG: hypothetical protein ACRDOA_01775 [Streptosporangiaceae bacterium]